MSRRTGSLLAAILAIAAVPTAAQWLNYPTPSVPRTADGKPNLSAPTPKTADGKPDLSGIWSLTKTGAGPSQLAPSEIKPWALKLAKEREETLGRDNPVVHCLPSGTISGLAKIVQTPGLIVMLGEDLTYRQIFLDGRELPKDPNPAWMGYSVGRWEGDTLVVESTGYNDRTWLELGYPHTEGLRITERFHRGEFGHLTVDVAYSDFAAYDKAWTAKIEGLFIADTDLLEFVCAENEKDSVHLVGKNSEQAKSTLKLAPEILNKYVGVYDIDAKDLGVPGREIREFKVALEEGSLRLETPSGVKLLMTPLSETSFNAGSMHIEFGKNDKGETQIVFQIAEGQFFGKRQK
jgi:hypothetical protein